MATRPSSWVPPRTWRSGFSLSRHSLVRLYANVGAQRRHLYINYSDGKMFTTGGYGNFIRNRLIRSGEDSKGFLISLIFFSPKSFQVVQKLSFLFDCSASSAGCYNLWHEGSRDGVISSCIWCPCANKNRKKKTECDRLICGKPFPISDPIRKSAIKK